MRKLLLLLPLFALLLASSSLLSSASSTAKTTIFQSNVDGIRVQVPNGWAVGDIDNTDPIAFFNSLSCPNNPTTAITAPIIPILDCKITAKKVP